VFDSIEGSANSLTLGPLLLPKYLEVKSETPQDILAIIKPNQNVSRKEGKAGNNTKTLSPFKAPLLKKLILHEPIAFQRTVG
jgi:hypothetical protein